MNRCLCRVWLAVNSYSKWLPVHTFMFTGPHFSDCWHVWSESSDHFLDCTSSLEHQYCYISWYAIPSRPLQPCREARGLWRRNTLPVAHQKDILRMITCQPNMQKWNSKGNNSLGYIFLRRKETLYSNNVLPPLTIIQVTSPLSKPRNSSWSKIKRINSLIHSKTFFRYRWFITRHLRLC
jgi:hypothetical protein